MWTAVGSGSYMACASGFQQQGAPMQFFFSCLPIFGCLGLRARLALRGYSRGPALGMAEAAQLACLSSWGLSCLDWG